jgi:DNA-binding transcriptional MerR regulator
MLRIGDFARLGRVTVKTLHHYDEEGLLKPAAVDGSSSYRLYSPDQLVQLARIMQLKDLGFALRDIRMLIRQPERLGEALERRRDELAQSIRDNRKRLARLEALQETLDPAEGLAIIVRRIEPIVALTSRARIDPASNAIETMFETLEREAAQAKARADVAPFLLLHDGGLDTGTLDAEACVPLNEKGDDLKAARLVEGACVAGTLTYNGPYQPALFTRLAQWIDANGSALSGPLREVYHRFGADNRGYKLPRRVLADTASGYVTELVAPIR